PHAGAHIVSPTPPPGAPATTQNLKKWDGNLSPYPPRRGGQKKQNPFPTIGTPRTYHRDIRKAGNQGSVCTYHRDIDGAPRCPHHRDISRLPYPAPAGGGIQGIPLQGSSTVRAPVQAGDAGSSPAPVASLTEHVLSIVNAELDALDAGRERTRVSAARHDEMAAPSKPAQKTARAVEGPRAGAAGNQARVHGERR